MKHTVIEISDLSLPELDIFARLTEAQLRSRLEPEKGIFIAESPKVIARALDAGCQPLAFLMERRHLDGQGKELLARCGAIPVYTADRAVLAKLTGYELTRGIPVSYTHLDVYKRQAQVFQATLRVAWSLSRC